jgi:hypothetical protein
LKLGSEHLKSTYLPKLAKDTVWKILTHE